MTFNSYASIVSHQIQQHDQPPGIYLSVYVLSRAEVLLRPSEGDDLHLGSVRFMTGSKRGASNMRYRASVKLLGKDAGVGRVL